MAGLVDFLVYDLLMEEEKPPAAMRRSVIFKRPADAPGKKKKTRPALASSKAGKKAEKKGG